MTLPTMCLAITLIADLFLGDPSPTILLIINLILLNGIIIFFYFVNQKIEDISSPIANFAIVFLILT